MMRHYHRFHPSLEGPRAAPRGGDDASPFPDGTLSIVQVLRAYGFSRGQFAGVPSRKIGVGSLGGGLVRADLDALVAALGGDGVLAPKVAVRTVGGAVDDPSSDPDSNVENMLDVGIAAATWSYLTGTPADVTICFGPNGTGDGMKLVTDDLVAAGCTEVSWSWGSPASGWDDADRSALSKSIEAAVMAGVTVCVAAGDDSVDDGTRAPTPDYPCSDENAWAVGGTSLLLASDGSIAVESAWGDGRDGDDGGGGGFDPRTPLPVWQEGIVPLPPAGTGIRQAVRGAPDSSANADPDSGWQVAANGGWTVVGGTSAACPFTLALVAVAKARMAQAGIGAGDDPCVLGLLTPKLYKARAAACNDIVVGSNGDPATPGWDPCTGNGSPKGAAFIEALSAS